jgi:hypothetical protein
MEQAVDLLTAGGLWDVHVDLAPRGQVLRDGWYGFELRVRDDDRALSNVIRKQWFTGD